MDERLIFKVEEDGDSGDNVVEAPAPKKKARKLTDKQKEALAKGRQRAKEKRALKLAEDVKFRDSVELKTEQRTKKKVNKKRQDAMAKMLRNEKISQFDSKVNHILSQQNCSLTYATMEKYCETFTEEDKVNPDKAKTKILGMIQHLGKHL
jgi:hypothetical protein